MEGFLRLQAPSIMEKMINIKGIQMRQVTCPPSFIFTGQEPGIKPASWDFWENLLIPPTGAWGSVGGPRAGAAPHGHCQGLQVGIRRTPRCWEHFNRNGIGVSGGERSGICKAGNIWTRPE